MTKLGKTVMAIIDFGVAPTPTAETTEIENGYGICQYCGLRVPMEDLVNGYCSLCDEEESEGDIYKKGDVNG